MGFVVPIAWPETLVKCVGMWYDNPMRWVGILKKGYYKVGHAAVLLINPKTGKVHYFDFGRYQAPLKNGRIRDEETDPDLTVYTQALIKNGLVKNLDEILKEVASNKSTHGKGKLVASLLTSINFERSYSRTKIWQEKGPIPYGPFDLSGTNCSRFVSSVTLLGSPSLKHIFRIRLPYTVSPSPMSNIKLINNQKEYYEVSNNQFEIVSLRQYKKEQNIELVDGNNDQQLEPKAVKI